MKKKITKKLLKMSTVFLLLLFLVLIGIQGSTIKVEAAASLGTKKTMTIGYGTMGTYRGDYSYDTYYNVIPYNIPIYHPVKGATYSFVSSNSKVVQVKNSSDKENPAGNLTGKIAGSATITCKQKLKGKTTTIGSIKVTVKKPSLILNSNHTVKDINMQISKGKQEIFRIPFILQQRNYGAKYTYLSNSKNITITEKFTVYTDKKTKNEEIRNSLVVDAKKTGNYTITIKETFNKKTTTIGSFKMTVDDSKYQNVITMEQGQTTTISRLLNSRGDLGSLSRMIEGVGFKITDSGNVLYASNAVETNDSKITAKKPGIAKINVYSYDGTTKKKGNFIESYLIQVTEPLKIEEKALHISNKTLDTYVGSAKYTTLEWEIRSTPLGYRIPRDSAAVTSSDESVAAIKKNTYSVQVIPKKAGTSTITVKYGTVSNSCNVTVYANEEEYLKSKTFINKTIPVNLNSTLYLRDVLVYPKASGYYVEGDGFDITDKNNTVSKDDNTSLFLKANKVGTAKLNIFEYDYPTNIKGNLIGSLYVKVEEREELTAEEIVLSKYTIETYLGVNSSNEGNDSSYFQWAVFPPADDWSPIDSDFGLWGNFSGSKYLRNKTSITFSDPSILDLKDGTPFYSDIDDDQGHLRILPKKAGKTTITFQCDNVTTSCDVIVYANKSEYQNAVENNSN